MENGHVYREYLMQALFGCSVTVLQYVNVSVLPFSGWFFTCSRALLYKNMEEENTISTGETLRCLVGLPRWGSYIGSQR